MIRRTLKFIYGVSVEGFIYLPQFREFVVLGIKKEVKKDE